LAIADFLETKLHVRTSMVIRNICLSFNLFSSFFTLHSSFFFIFDLQIPAHGNVLNPGLIANETILQAVSH